MKKNSLLPILILSVTFCVSTSYATPIIDFADSKFAVVHGKTIETVSDVYGSLDITFKSFSSTTPKNLTYNPGPGGGVDGIGIDDDEVSNDEILYFEFSEKINISKIHLTDLFYEGNPRYQEQGKYMLFVGNSLSESSWSDWYSFEAPTENLPYPMTNGEYEINIDPLLSINAIQFKAFYDGRNDLSVRGIDPAAVPEPATMILVGFGLIGLAGFNRRRIKKI